MKDNFNHALTVLRAIAIGYSVALILSNAISDPGVMNSILACGALAIIWEYIDRLRKHKEMLLADDT